MKVRSLRFLGFPDYCVLENGTIWSLYREPRQRKLVTIKNGYQTIVLKDKAGKAHAFYVVLKAFVGACPSGMECRHYPDQDKSNNTLGNLSWGTKQRNMKDN